MAKTVFEIEDLVLGRINLPHPCPIKIEIRGDMLFLYVGQRDWQWDFHTGELIGCGTTLVEEEV